MRRSARNKPASCRSGRQESGDGILSGIYDGRSYYLKEDLIFELLSHLGEREPAFRRYFAWGNVFDDYPFGHRLDLGLAGKSCPMLVGRG